MWLFSIFLFSLLVVVSEVKVVVVDRHMVSKAQTKMLEVRGKEGIL